MLKPEIQAKVVRFIARNYGVSPRDIRIVRVWQNDALKSHKHTDDCERDMRDFWWGISPRTFGVTCSVYYFDVLANDCNNSVCHARTLIEYLYSPTAGGTLHVSDCGDIAIRID